MRLAALLVAAALSTACLAPRHAGPAIPALGGPDARCRVGAGRSNPLVTEWPASEKANLEAQLAVGAVAVEYTGCSMRVLTQCSLPGRYGWLRTTPSSDSLEIEDVDELYAKLPIGAASLEGELARSGKLTISTLVAGQLRLSGATPADVPAYGECARATHVVSAVAVGAFSLSGSGRAGARADLGVAGVALGARADRSAGVARSAGDWQACGQGTDAAPHPNCRSPIQVVLWPIQGRAAEEGPAGTVKVDLLSANASHRWDVYYDDEVICTTPCSRWLDPARPLLLRARDTPYLRGSERIRIPDLERAAGSGSVQVQAHGTSNGKLATGITFTSLGGMATIAGIALTAVGCSDDARSGMCTGGLVTLAAGSAVTAGSISLIVDSLPRAEIRPGGAGGRSVTVAVGPGFVAGRF
jgi:hypothetical protein